MEEIKAMIHDQDLPMHMLMQEHHQQRSSSQVEDNSTSSAHVQIVLRPKESASI
jgi:hypothetical protein